MLIKMLQIKVSKRILLLEAAIVWTVAGVILLLRGSSMLLASSGFTLIKISLCILFGLLFFWLIFLKISSDHIKRITTLSVNRLHFFEFFSRKSYIMMLCMISLGVFLRKTSFVPIAYLSLAYITMGIPLLLSSIRFYYRWLYYIDYL
jgi:hypothetical protein